MTKYSGREIYASIIKIKPVPVLARSKAWGCRRSPADIVGSNPKGAWMFVCCECCVCFQVEVSATS